MMKTIEVTKKHLNAAIKESLAGSDTTCCCLVFQAIKDAGLDISFCSFDFFLLKGRGEFDLPAMAARLIAAYDRARAMQFRDTYCLDHMLPTTFVVEVP